MSRLNWPSTEDPEVNEQPDVDNPHKRSQRDNDDFLDVNLPHSEEIFSDDLNVQPVRQNPHDFDEGSENESDEVEDQVKGYLTREFAEAEQEYEQVLADAAELSEELADSYQGDGVYLMAEVGPEGVEPVAVGNKEQFFIDDAYNPDIFEGSFSPLEVLDTTSYAEEMMCAIMDYDTMDLDSKLDISSVQEDCEIELEYLEAANRRVIVAPGLEDLYREAGADSLSE